MKQKVFCLSSSFQSFVVRARRAHVRARASDVVGDECMRPAAVIACISCRVVKVNEVLFFDSTLAHAARPSLYNYMPKMILTWWIKKKHKVSQFCSSKYVYI